MCARGVLLLCCVLSVSLSPAQGKVIRGVASSRRQQGQFISKFCFHDKQALLKYTINASVQGRLYFYLDETWGYASAEQDCAKKMAMAKFGRELEKSDGQQYLKKWIRPHFWFIVYADPHTCNTITHPPYEAMEYEITFLTPDAQGNANDHFGDDLRDS